MSLDYDLRKVQNRDESDGGWLRTQGIIFGCMVTRLGEVTAANAIEWYARYKIVNPDSPITLADVQAHVGLRTNVFPNLSREDWAKSVMVRHLELAVWDVERAERAAGRPVPEPEPSQDELEEMIMDWANANLIAEQADVLAEAFACGEATVTRDPDVEGQWRVAMKGGLTYQLAMNG